MLASTRNPDATSLRTEVQTADFLGISIRTLQSWRLRGGGPSYIKVGRAVRYRQDMLDSWLAGNTRVSTSDTGDR